MIWLGLSAMEVEAYLLILSQQLTSFPAAQFYAAAHFSFRLVLSCSGTPAALRYRTFFDHDRSGRHQHHPQGRHRGVNGSYRSRHERLIVILCRRLIRRRRFLHSVRRPQLQRMARRIHTLTAHHSTHSLHLRNVALPLVHPVPRPLQIKISHIHATGPSQKTAHRFCQTQ